MGAVTPRFFIIAGVVAAVVVLGSIKFERGSAGAPVLDGATEDIQAGEQRGNPPDNSKRPPWERKDPSLKWPEKNTPAKQTESAAKSVLGGVSSVISSQGPKVIRNFVAGDDPNLLLIEYAKSGDVAEMKEMLNHGANPNYCARGGNWETPLMYAAGSDNLEAVKLLLQQPGIDITARDKDYQTARTYSRIDSPIDNLLKSKGLSR